MRIGELARLTGHSTDTLRYYEKRGLLRATRASNGYRDYGEDARIALDLIATGKALGFTLTEIEAELPGLAQGGLTEEKVADILRGKIGVVEHRIAELEALRDHLSKRLAAACPFQSGR